MTTTQAEHTTCKSWQLTVCSEKRWERRTERIAKCQPYPQRIKETLMVFSFFCPRWSTAMCSMINKHPSSFNLGPSRRRTRTRRSKELFWGVCSCMATQCWQPVTFQQQFQLPGSWLQTWYVTVCCTLLCEHKMCLIYTRPHWGKINRFYTCDKLYSSLLKPSGAHSWSVITNIVPSPRTLL